AGVQRGDLVLVRVGNDERFPAAAFGVWMAGAGMIAMHPSAPRQDIIDVAESMCPSVIIADPADAVVRDAGLPVVDTTSFAPRGDESDSDADRFDVPEDIVGSDTALVLLTSGSTGRPKGVALTHDSAWSNLRATVSAFRSDTSPSPLPPEP